MTVRLGFLFPCETNQVSSGTIIMLRLKPIQARAHLALSVEKQTPIKNKHNYQSIIFLILYQHLQ